MSNLHYIALTFIENGLDVREVIPANIELDEPPTIDLMNGVIVTMTNDFKYFTLCTLEHIGVTETADNVVHKMTHTDLGEYTSVSETIEAIKRQYN